MKKLKLIILNIFLLINFSCGKDFLDETAYTDVTLDYIYTTPEGLNAALVGLYQVHRSLYNSNFGESQRAIIMAAKSDLTVVRAGQIALWAQLRWGHSPDGYQGQLLHAFWKHYYKVIDRSNAIIKNAELSEDLNDEMRILLSEAKVLRAEAYFTLFRMFNNIYVTTEPTSPENAFNKINEKSSENEIFELIESDLEYAEKYLDWVNTPGKVNLAMAKHLYAKVSMWQSNWEKAIIKSEDIINSGFYSLMASPKYVFDGINNYGARSITPPNRETIFNLQFSNPNIGGGIKTLINWNYITNYGQIRGAKYDRNYGGRGAGWVYPNQYMLSLFEDDDLRIDNAYFRTKYYYNDKPNLPAGKSLGDEITIPFEFTNFWYQRRHPTCLKFSPNKNDLDWDPNVGVSQANFIIYRLAETYLIASEAYMRLNGNNDQNAINYLNRIRTRAGVDTLNFIDQNTVLEERARELSFEGQRWYTLKRMGVLFERITQFAGNDGYKDAARENMQPHYINFPIPSDQLDLMGPDYPQNDGY